MALALTAAVLAGCSSDQKTPAQARRDRVEQRLRSTFSGAQARCILDDVDDAVLRALDRPTALAPDTPAMQRYSAAVAHCVVDPDGTTTTSTAPPTTAATTAPAGPVTTGG